MQPLTPTTTQQTNPSAAGVTVEFHWADGTAGEPRNVALALLGLNQKPEPGTIINYSGKRWRVGDVSPSVEGDSVSGSYPLIELGG
jgi:hypothetical protein